MAELGSKTRCSSAEVPWGTKHAEAHSVRLTAMGMTAPRKAAETASLFKRMERDREASGLSLFVPALP